MLSWKYAIKLNRILHPTLGVKSPCPAGTYLTTDKGRFITDCINCTGGYFCPDEAMAVKPSGDDLKCKAGYFCFAKATDSEPSDDIINTPPNFGICPQGYYCPIDGTVEPIGCLDGRYNAELGNITFVLVRLKCHFLINGELNH